MSVDRNVKGRVIKHLVEAISMLSNNSVTPAPVANVSDKNTFSKPPGSSPLVVASSKKLLSQNLYNLGQGHGMGGSRKTRKVGKKAKKLRKGASRKH